MTAKTDWFVRCVDAVGHVVANEAGHFLCPLCLHWYTDPDDVSREHAPPESAGGHRVALTCVECNATSGHQLDAHVRPLENIFDFATGTLSTSVPGTVRIGNAVFEVVKRLESRIAPGCADVR